ncbi:MAG: hypothetical protein II393_02040 [Cytophagales bacterium]|nr:hypothetical protein [Cytophagales bacterium]
MRLSHGTVLLLITCGVQYGLFVKIDGKAKEFVNDIWWKQKSAHYTENKEKFSLRIVTKTDNKNAQGEDIYSIDGKEVRMGAWGQFERNDALGITLLKSSALWEIKYIEEQKKVEENKKEEMKKVEENKKEEVKKVEENKKEEFEKVEKTVFLYCSDISSVPKKYSDFLNVEGVGMFMGVDKLVSVTLKKSMLVRDCVCCFNMFSDCKNLTSVDLGVLDWKKISNVNGLFKNCSKLKELIWCCDKQSTQSNIMLLDIRLLFSCKVNLEKVWVLDRCLLGNVVEQLGKIKSFQKLYIKYSAWDKNEPLDELKGRWKKYFTDSNRSEKEFYEWIHKKDCCVYNCC